MNFQESWNSNWSRGLVGNQTGRNIGELKESGRGFDLWNEECDLAPATSLTRVGPLLGNDLSNIGNKFSEGRYGSVAPFFVVCKDDNMVSEKFQRWMTQNYSVRKVMELKGADHTAMFWAPQDLSAALLHVARPQA
ncbi:hypothetical protein Sjap_010126 [Stephania japonica]|uniref:Uncharacterized protein n=1 Tax=Stephania japonica TaxID=461633 RepID=A0AAP0P4C1_9MAGN